MSPDRNLNALWLRCILDEVIAAGVQDAVLCVGGRSIALCLAIRHDPRFRHVIPHTDERSASFLALGLSKSTGRPVAIVTTSGSAVANLVPALTEADALHIPLVLLTCDRPSYLRNACYNQMTDHIGACQAFVAANVDLPNPEATDVALVGLRESVSTVLAHIANPDTRGPVHINIPLQGMYDSTDVLPGWQMPSLSALALNGRRDASGNSLPMVTLEQEKSFHVTIGALQRGLHLCPGLRGLIVAGPECPFSSEELNAFSKGTGFPVLADAASGLRRPAVANLVAPFDALVGVAGKRLASPQLIIRFGLEPTLSIVHQYLLESPSPTIKITTRMVERDYLHPECEMLIRPTREDLLSLAAVLGPGDPVWLENWLGASTATACARRKIVAELDWGEMKAADIICNTANFDFLHFGNSMSIRNGDMLAEPAQWGQLAFSSRGVNGIDGTTATFLGELVGTQKRGLLLLGDLAFIHDLTALTFYDTAGVNGCICIMNNGGGAIFDLLPASRLPAYENTIRNTSSIDIEAAARCFHLPYHLADNEDRLASALEKSRDEGGVHIVEVRVPARSLAENHIALATQLKRFASHYSEVGN